MVLPERLLASRLRAAKRHLLKSKRLSGQSLVEFALVLPLLIVLLVMAVDFGRLYFSYIQINNAAREGAAFGAASPTDHVGITDRALQETNTQRQSGETPIVVSETCANSAGTAINCADATAGMGAGNTIAVDVSEEFSFLTPLVNGLVNNSLELRASATATVLGYAAAGVPSAVPGSCSTPFPSFNVIVTSGLSVFADPAGSSPASPSTCAISGFNWTWGDGNDTVGTASGDNYNYSAAGTYTVTLEVTNQGGSATTTGTVTVPAPVPPPTCAPPTAGFTWTSNGKKRTYTDASSVADAVNCPITDWLWTFHDLDDLQSNVQNPGTYTYKNNSSHPVTLQVTNAGGTRSITRDS
jgi:PKD repeat protein